MAIYVKAQGHIINQLTDEEISSGATIKYRCNAYSSSWPNDAPIGSYDNAVLYDEDESKLYIECIGQIADETLEFASWKLEVRNRRDVLVGTFTSDLNPSHGSGVSSDKGWNIYSLISDSYNASRRAALDFYIYVTPQLLYVTLSYDANGGVGAPEPTSGDEGMFSISEDVPSRSGYYFLGWALDPSATEAQYSPGQDIEVNDNTILYAVWGEEPGPGPGPGPSPTPHSGYLTRNKTSGYLEFGPIGHLVYD